jgi:hypothetical protein
MADTMFFSRDSKVFVAPLAADGTESGVWEIPVLDGFSFSQATNSSEITLNEMVSSGTSRRGRKMFNDSLAPAEWSFSTYARPFKSAGSNTPGNASKDGTGRTHAVEEVLWAMMVGDAAHTDTDATTAPAFTGLTSDTTDLNIAFNNSNKVTLGKANIYFTLGSTSGDNGGDITYKIANCCVNEAGLDFDIDGITTINWSGMGTIITEQDDAPGRTVYEKVSATDNFIRNRLTELVASSGSPTSVDPYNLTLTGGSITISNNMTFLTPETLGVVNTPLDHVTGTRSVSGSFTCYLSSTTNSSMDLFENLISGTSTVTNDFSLNFKVGGASGTPRLELLMPHCHLEVPTHSIEDVISIEANFHALGSDIDDTDEIAITYVGA